jgi:hypothetical protein
MTHHDHDIDPDEDDEELVLVGYPGHQWQRLVR